MYHYLVEDVIQPENLTWLINDFKTQILTRFERLEAYYKTRNKIIERTMTGGKPNNMLAHGFTRYISDMATGYFIGKGVQYQTPDEEYNTLLLELLKVNATDSLNFAIAKEASKKGIAFELLYIDEEGRLKTKKLNANEVIPIYSPRINNYLACAIRLWEEREIGQDISTHYAALYTRDEIITYKKDEKGETYREESREIHMFSDVPIIVYHNNEEQTGDYEDVISLIDAYDLAQSDTANDNEYFTDAYLLIIGAGGGFGDGDDGEDSAAAYATMRRERVIHLDEKGQAQWLVKNINDTAQENYKSRLFKDIFLLSNVPAMSDESFAGNLTGVALKYKLIGLEQLCIEKEYKFRAAQSKKLELVTEYINTLHNKNFDSDAIEIRIERNFIENDTELVENAEKLTDIVSKKTLLSIVPYVKDVDTELEQIKKEQEEQEVQKIKGDYPLFGAESDTGTGIDGGEA